LAHPKLFTDKPYVVPKHRKKIVQKICKKCTENLHCAKRLRNIVSHYTMQTKIRTMKEILASLEPSLVDVLPQGAINKLAERYKRRRQSITKMLTGQIGKEENVQAIVAGAKDLIQEHRAIQDQVLEALTGV